MAPSVETLLYPSLGAREDLASFGRSRQWPRRRPNPEPSYDAPARGATRRAHARMGAKPMARFAGPCCHGLFPGALRVRKGPWARWCSRPASPLWSWASWCSSIGLPRGTGLKRRNGAARAEADQMAASLASEREELRRLEQEHASVEGKTEAPRTRGTFKGFGKQETMKRKNIAGILALVAALSFIAWR